MTVLGFPCNQFAGQEPGTDAEILEFATSKYEVTFPMFHKIEVNGDGAAPLYQWLKTEQPGEGASSDITWNFEKFLVDRRRQRRCSVRSDNHTGAGGRSPRQLPLIGMIGRPAS